jgi:hypothetical protein
MALINSAASATVSATVLPTSWWLKNPVDPTKNMAIRTPGWAPTQNKKTAKFDPPARSYSVVLHGPNMGDEGPLLVRTLSAAEYAALKALLDSNRTLLLQTVTGQQWYVEVSGGHQRTFVAAKSTESYPVRHYWEWSVPLVEVNAP